MSEIAALIVMLAAGWFWLAGMRARDVAVDAARRACAADGVQLLDDTVALASLRPRRRTTGALALRRVYRFEFSDTGNNRLGGSITLLGGELEALYLEPHLGSGASLLHRVGPAATHPTTAADDARDTT